VATALPQPAEDKPPTQAEASPRPSDSPLSSDESSNAPPDRSVGYVLVHSLDLRASVYMMFTRLGPVEEKLKLPCGRRFVAIGMTVPGKKEPTWLAPGKTIEVP
jgi:hypothetical protein